MFGRDTLLHRVFFLIRLVWIIIGIGVAVNLILYGSELFVYSEHVFGFCRGCGNTPQYLFLSGSGSDLAYLAAAWGALHTAYILYRKHNCHEPWCLRIGHDVIDNKGTLSCWHHHPEGKPRPGHIKRAHEAHKTFVKPVDYERWHKEYTKVQSALKNQNRINIDKQDPQAT